MGTLSGNDHEVAMDNLPVPIRAEWEILLLDAVNDNIDVVYAGTIEIRHFGQIEYFTVDPDPHIPLRPHTIEQFAERAFPAAHNRREHLYPGAIAPAHYTVDHLLGGLRFDRPAAFVTMRLADPGIEQPQIVVNFGDGTDG